MRLTGVAGERVVRRRPGARSRDRRRPGGDAGDQGALARAARGRGGSLPLLRGGARPAADAARGGGDGRARARGGGAGVRHARRRPRDREHSLDLRRRARARTVPLRCRDGPARERPLFSPSPAPWPRSTSRRRNGVPISVRLPGHRGSPPGDARRGPRPAEPGVGRSHRDERRPRRSRGSPPTAAAAKPAPRSPPGRATRGVSNERQSQCEVLADRSAEGAHDRRSRARPRRAEAIQLLQFTQKSGAPVLQKIIESAVANAKQDGADVDMLFVSKATVDKGPNKFNRRWRPRAMGRATRVTKGISHIVIELDERK